MSPAIVRRELVKRNVVEDWGKSLQRWVQERPPATVFVLAIVLAFLASLVLLALVWETIRKCRASSRVSADRERAEWIQLPDGSSVLTQGRVPNAREMRQGNFTPGAYLGPMTSLLRDARQGGPSTNGGESPARYVPTQTGPTEYAANEAQTTTGGQALYDPPLSRPDFPRPLSTSTSQYSEETKVDASLNTYLPTTSPLPVTAVTPIPAIPPPPRSSPSDSSSTIPAIPVSPPRSRPVGFGHTRQASSGGFQPKGLQLVGTVGGESQFSTPKSTPVPTSSPLASPPRHSRTPSSLSGWSAPTLAASPAPSDATKNTFVSSIFPPRVDLKRTGTWSSSISSWIPGYSDKDEKPQERDQKEEEEETSKLVDQALKNAR
ncbi:uncharacterized protein JCM6883_002181 [Sporobolomyces salmoneus]|uniref:uncharacterized protein n=1 Tax=Sporobolomyces salmoneus TaxID=183962 RepID=UPI00316F2BFF